jgi:hypothetical protein
MDDAIGRFAPYAKSGVPAFGGDSAPFGGPDPFSLVGMTMLNMLPYQAFGGLDSAATSAAVSGAGAGTEIMSTPSIRISSAVDLLVARQQRRVPWAYPATWLCWEWEWVWWRAESRHCWLGDVWTHRPADNPCEREEEKAELVCGHCTRYWECAHTL